ncbi:MAG: response regulator transcription factor [Gaiellaceae bacterium]|jgi:DNA-binding NarL/FixJ family response regulator
MVAVTPPRRLSPRQRQILGLMADGVRVKEIAVRFGLSETTVRNHVRELLRRLDCHSQLEAVARAREWKLL